MLQPLLATPAEKSWIDDVSWAPVRRRSLSWEVDQVKILSQYNPHNNLCLKSIRYCVNIKRHDTHLSLFGIICLDMPHVMPKNNYFDAILDYDYINMLLGELFNGRLNCLHSSGDPESMPSYINSNSILHFVPETSKIFKMISTS